ncbi:hypothetical protein E2C01_066760 [Portunus trituberculatus]|uniref:Uncharacterized protein n=1 Tax=Portunus trituberculatus TaxID=210409 RepID=A0A5B7HVJ3_PORTR|nr:hypothetical protein [Portunus trituberculatus]
MAPFFYADKTCQTQAALLSSYLRVSGCKGRGNCDCGANPVSACPASSVRELGGAGDTPDRLAHILPSCSFPLGWSILGYLEYTGRHIVEDWISLLGGT